MNFRVSSFNFKDNYHCSKILSVLDDQRQQRQLCDVILKVADDNFYAHRNVLAATSPYFQTMFTNDNFPESQMKEITMKGIKPNALEKLINFAYRGEVQIDDENVRSLMMGASLLLVENVRNACAEFLVSQLNPPDAFEIRNFAKSLDCTHLHAAANEYIRQHFGEVAMSEEFVELSFEELLETIEHDDLAVDSEETTYEASMRWVKANEEERAPLLPQILSKIRLNLLSPQFLVERVSRDDLIRMSLQCRDLVEEAKDFQLLHERREHLGSSRGRHGNCVSNVGKIYVVSGSNIHGMRSVEIYDPVTNKWEMGEEMSTARYGSGAAVSLGKLYVFGGIVLQYLSTVEVFDPKIKKWSRGQKIMTKRRNVGVAVVKNLIYVCGGYGGYVSGMHGHDLNTVECFCPTTDTWSTVAPMMKCRNGGAAATLGGYLYVAGGCYLGSVEKYDPGENSWIQVKPMIQKRCLFGLTALNGKLYACGGRNENGQLQSAEVYDPAEDTWKLISQMNCKREGLALVGNMGKLWAIGGFDSKSDLSSVEVYDPVVDKWSFMTPMSLARSSAAAAVIGS